MKDFAGNELETGDVIIVSNRDDGKLIFARVADYKEPGFIGYLRLERVRPFIFTTPPDNVFLYSKEYQDVSTDHLRVLFDIKPVS